MNHKSPLFMCLSGVSAQSEVAVKLPDTSGQAQPGFEVAITQRGAALPTGSEIYTPFADLPSTPLGVNITAPAPEPALVNVTDIPHNSTAREYDNVAFPPAAPKVPYISSFTTASLSCGRTYRSSTMTAAGSRSRKLPLLMQGISC